MNIRLALLNIYLPNKLKIKKLRELLEVTAKAFQIQQPPIEGTHFANALGAYAAFTRDAAKQQMDIIKDVSVLKRQLYDGAFRFGERLREELRIDSRKDALKAARLLYRAIGIDFRCSESGEVIINRCYFSNIYSCEVCWIISSLDEGLIAGLSAGGRLWFVSRITEGSSSCIGAIEFERVGRL